MGLIRTLADWTVHRDPALAYMHMHEHALSSTSSVRGDDKQQHHAIWPSTHFEREHHSTRKKFPEWLPSPARHWQRGARCGARSRFRCCDCHRRCYCSVRCNRAPQYVSDTCCMCLLPVPAEPQYQYRLCFNDARAHARRAAQC